MKYKIGKSVKNNFAEAISEATIGLNSPKLILFFSNVDKFEIYAEKIKEKFNNSIVIGSTTFAGFCKDGAYKNGLLLMGIEDGIECYGGVLEEVERYPLKLS